LAQSPSKEVEIMKKFLMALVVLAIASVPALAGPNQYGVIVVHNTGILWSTDLQLPPVSPVPACADIVNEVPMGSAPSDVSENLVWKVYAAFPVDAHPRLKGCGWGVGHPSVGGGQIVIGTNDAPSPAVFYLTTAGWPADNTFIGMSFTDSVRTGIVDELYYFAGYAYAGLAGEPQTFCIIPHSGETNRFFLDDAVPQNADAIAGYGCLGFGTAGYTPCPVTPVPGACCFADGSCSMLLAAECQTAGGSFVGGACTPTLCAPPPSGACCLNQVCDIVTPAQCAAVGGQYFGDGSTCTPGLCPPVAVKTTSWGQIKSDYR
jgi:hypothetical protein